MGKDDYRREIGDLIDRQSRGLPVCFVDGKPCDYPERGCEMIVFGVCAPDGKDKVVWRCPRLKSHES